MLGSFAYQDLEAVLELGWSGKSAVVSCRLPPLVHTGAQPRLSARPLSPHLLSSWAERRLLPVTLAPPRTRLSLPSQAQLCLWATECAGKNCWTPTPGIFLLVSWSWETRPLTSYLPSHEPAVAVSARTLCQASCWANGPSPSTWECSNQFKPQGQASGWPSHGCPVRWRLESLVWGLWELNYWSL